MTTSTTLTTEQVIAIANEYMAIDARVTTYRESIADLIDFDYLDSSRVLGYYGQKYDNYTDLIEIGLTCFGEYTGSLVEKTNLEHIKQNYLDLPGIWVIKYDFATEAIVFDPNILELPEYSEFKDTIDGLCDYPLIDDMEYSAIEQEAIQEAWDSYLKDEFIRAIEQSYEVTVEIIDNDELIKDVFFDAVYSLNYEFINETSDSIYVDIDRLLIDMNEHNLIEQLIV